MPSSAAWRRISALPRDNAPRRHEARREILKALLEHAALAAVAPDDAAVVAHVAKRAVDDGARNPASRRLILEAGEPGGEAGRIISTGRSEGGSGVEREEDRREKPRDFQEIDPIERGGHVATNRMSSLVIGAAMV